MMEKVNSINKTNYQKYYQIEKNIYNRNNIIKWNRNCPF